MIKIKDYIKARLHEISTKVGVVLGAISTIAAQYQAVDVKFAYIGAAAGLLLMLYKESK